MKIDLKQAVEILNKNDNYIIVTHANPDGDTLGGGYALMRALRKCGKKAKVVNEKAIPKKYSFLVSEDDEISEENAYIVSVDIADPKLMGELEEKFGGKVQLCIDHHGSNVLYAEKTLLKSDSASVCEIVYEVIKEMQINIDKEMASCLYTGISTDTGCFRYSNVTSATHKYAGELIDLGAKHAEIDTLMFETKSPQHFALERLCLEGMKILFDGKVAIITLTQQMYAQSGADESCADAIASIPRQVEGVKIGVTIKEKASGEFKISVRTHEPYDASEICKKLGGGGHMRAAGCQVDCSIDEAIEKLCDVIEKVL